MVSVSIIVPTLNEEGEIGHLLASIASQHYAGPIETIVVDGGSEDRTVSIVTQRNVRLEHSAPGVSRQRNLGAAEASSELLVFLDADTRLNANFILKLVDYYLRAPFAAACPWFIPRTRRPDIHVVYAALNGLFFLSQLRFHTGAGVCIATPRSIFEKLGGFDESMRLGEDVDYLQRAAEEGAHRHLLIPLATSARRFETYGTWNTAMLYARISPALISGNKEALRKIEYPATKPKGRDSS